MRSRLLFRFYNTCAATLPLFPIALKPLEAGLVVFRHPILSECYMVVVVLPSLAGVGHGSEPARTATSV